MRSPADILLIAPLFALSCAQPAPPPLTTTPQNVVGSTAPAGPASASASASAQAPRKGCIPERFRKGWVSDLFSQESSPVFCLAVADNDQSCWRALADGLADSAPRTRPAATPRRTSSGLHSIDSAATSVKVCPASSAAPCSTISPKGFAGADQSEFSSELAWHIPADTSPDGTRLMLVRHEGKRSERVFLETYEISTARRTGRFPLQVDQFVSRIEWIGRLALLTICVEEGPGCSARFFDPGTGKTFPVGTGARSINLYGIENPAHRASAESWAIVETNGSRALMVNSNTGSIEGEIPTGLSADVESGVEVTRISPDRIAIVSGAPRGGDLVIVDLASRKVASRLAAPTCPAFP